MKNLICFFIVSFFVFGCNKSDKEQDKEKNSEKAPDSFGKSGIKHEPAKPKAKPLNISGKFAGYMPCTDCDEIDMLVQINPDKTYLVEEVFKTKGKPDKKYYNIGRWKALSDSTIWLKGGPLGYSGSGGFWMLKLQTTDSLRLLGKGTIKEDSMHNYFLTRSNEDFEKDNTFKMSGLLSMKEEELYFKECGTQKEFRVSKKGSFKKAHNQLQRMQKEMPEKADAFVIIMGHLSDLDDNGTHNEVVINKLMSFNSDNVCEPIDINTPPPGDRKSY